MTTYTADDFKNARFATHPTSGKTLERKLDRDAAPWMGETRVCRNSDAEMARDGWAPVREGPNPEQHGPQDDWHGLFLAEKRRANQAEEERDENGALLWLTQDALRYTERQRDDAQAYAALWKETARALFRSRKQALTLYSEAYHRATKAEREKVQAQGAAKTLGKVIEDQCRDIARITRSEHLVGEDGDADWGAIWERGHEMADKFERADQERDSVQAALVCATQENDRLRANHPRPLTADDITDEMVERAWDFLTGVGETWSHHEVLALLRAALTEPPARPEGAEAVRVVLDTLRADDGEWMTYASDKDLDGLADALAELGVRVATEEGS